VSWRGLHLSEPVRLAVKRGQLWLERDGGDKFTFPLEDMGFIVLDTQQALMSAALLSACAEYGCLVITTDSRHMPNGSLLPHHSYYRQPETVKAQLALSVPRQKRLWQNLIRRKIENQAACLYRYTGSDVSRRLTALIPKVKSGDPDNVEGLASRLYWSALFSEFRRDHKAEDRRNSLLNYGYALVRAAIARDLASEGFIPSLGIHHRSMQNAFNLADDFIEPWRPIVDALAFRRAAADPEGTELTRDDRRAMATIFSERVELGDGVFALVSALRKSMESLRSYFVSSGKTPLLLPRFPTSAMPAEEE